MDTYAPDLLQTKLAIPPARADRVPRMRLIQQLDNSLECPLTLICAPAGFGKTSLITDWHAQPDIPHLPLAWLSLDEDDNDPPRFLRYLISALQNMGNIISDDLLTSLQSPQPPSAKVILTTLVSRIELFPHRFLLVLDDYHVVTAAPLREAVSFLLDHMPSQMRLVITSREDPLLPLARLRARGQLAEIRADDLRFTAEESNQFLVQMLGIKLNDNQLIDLDTRTEGWVAGLQLAALAMKGRKDLSSFISAFTGSHRYILDYLTDEVLTRQPEPVRNFLLQTSILSRLNGSLCDAVTNRTGGQVMLEQIERSNLFLIALDEERSWFRYHHLFGDMLRRQLLHSSPDIVPELYRNASLWFEQNGNVDEAVANSLHGGDVERAAWLVEQFGERMHLSSEVSTAVRWLKALPEEAIRARPKLDLNYAFMLINLGNYDEGERRLAEIEQVMLNQENIDGEHVALMGRAAAVRATVSFLKGYDAKMTIAVARQALAQLPGSDAYWHAWVKVIIGRAFLHNIGEIAEAERNLTEALPIAEKLNDNYLSLYILAHLGRVYIIAGRLQETTHVTAQALKYEFTSGRQAQARLQLSHVHYEHNDLASAWDEAAEARRLMQLPWLSRFSLTDYIIMARIEYVRGNKREAAALLQELAQLRPEGFLKQLWRAASVWQTWLSLMQGDVVAAAQWAEPYIAAIDEPLNFIFELEHIMVARVQMAQGQLDAAGQLLERLCSAAHTAGRFGRVITISALQALVARMQGNLERALESISYSLSLAEPEGYVRTFIDEGAPMAELLREAQKRGIMPQYVAKLLAVFAGELSPKSKTRSQEWTGHDIEPLSDREREVLQLIVTGASNREIARELFISLGTVKKHLGNIFVKLDANSRAQAIFLAKQHNLL